MKTGPAAGGGRNKKINGCSYGIFLLRASTVTYSKTHYYNYPCGCLPVTDKQVSIFPLQKKTKTLSYQQRFRFQTKNEYNRQVCTNQYFFAIAPDELVGAR